MSIEEYGKEERIIFEDPCPKSEGFIGKLIDLFSKKKS